VTLDLLLAMTLVAATYLAMFGMGELLHRRWHVAAETTRRIDHLAAGGIALALPFLFDSPWPVVALAILFVAFLSGAMVLGWLRSIHAIARHSLGAFLYPVAIALTFLLTAQRFADYAVAVLALALADVAAGVAGERWGRHPYASWGQAKSWEGSLAAFAATALMSCSVLVLGGDPVGVAFATGILSGVVVALVEGALPWGLDNLGIPLAALASLHAARSIPSGSLVLLVAAAIFAMALATPRSRRVPGEAGSAKDEAVSGAE
jgi:dolichol kinase